MGDHGLGEWRSVITVIPFTSTGKQLGEGGEVMAASSLLPSGSESG